MSVNVKIHQGTGRLTGQALCLSCSRGYVRHDAQGEHRYCRTFDRYLPGDVYECSEYYNKNLPSLTSLHEIAWMLVTDKTKKIGFKPPKKTNDTPPEFYD